MKTISFVHLPFCKVAIFSLLTGWFFLFAPMVSFGQERMCRNNPDRSWWKVSAYDLSFDFTDTITEAIQGINELTAIVKQIPEATTRLQIDLKSPMVIDSVQSPWGNLSWERDSNAYLIKIPLDQLQIGDSFKLKIFFKGRPQEAKNAPWDGGFVRTRDANGKLWWAVACQGEGAYLWFPCKNFQGDEPQRVTETYTVPAAYQAIGNGRLINRKASPDNKTVTYVWQVVNPINNYDITFYLGDYVHWQSVYKGEKGSLDLDYYALRKDSSLAVNQWNGAVPAMLACFESKLGPYPFYEDGYKLVEAPYLGMEHQSAVAYGNGFQEGYLGRDRSRSGVGLLFDFIIVHESAHEWFGNSITAYDIADEWVHEGFASYAETIMADCIAGKRMGEIYQKGKKYLIRNVAPVEGKFGECDEGNGDAYDKGGFLLHTIRLVLDDDPKFFGLLREISSHFYHQIVTGRQIEQFINDYTGHDFTPVFDQYLRKANLPVLLFQKDKDGKLTYQWTDCVSDFNLPVFGWKNGKKRWLFPTTKAQTLSGWTKADINSIDKNFLIEVQQ